MNQAYRKLNEAEILQLQKNGCHCQEWEQIEVKEGFNPNWVHSVTFSGFVRLGVFEKFVHFNSGESCHSGVFKTHLHNCEVGDNSVIAHVTHIKNYKIGNNVGIRNAQELIVSNPSSFGNGVQVSVLDESGSRKLPIFDQLSSHIAYAYTLYRYDTLLIEKLNKLFSTYLRAKTSKIGHIGNNVRIENTATLREVNIQSGAELNNISRLTNGTVGENVYVGHNVIADDFIFQSDAQISDGAKLTRCLVGQASKIGSGFSATDSAFFANSHLENGEACALFGGPYTVSHHKSTLLIGGLFSFMNAGSGSNQSNHMYKFGPIHYGIAERGVKLASDSYIAHPIKLGAFTMVMGRHYNHPDTSVFPFSYLIEKNGKSYLFPAINFTTLGTLRDSLKWEVRDARKSKQKLDSLSFSLLNPSLCERIIEAKNTLLQLVEEQQNNEIYTYRNCLITHSSLKRGMEYYHLILDKYFGDKLITNFDFRNDPPLNSQDNWIDFGGLVAPKSEIDQILQTANTFDSMNKAFANLLVRTKQLEWEWVRKHIGKTNHKEILDKWFVASNKLNELIIKDATKEFAEVFQVSFGVDGEKNTPSREFELLRGDFEENSFIKNLRKQMETDKEIYEALIAQQ